MSERAGRTTRMLERAVSLAREGGYVIVLAANETERRLLFDRLADQLAGVDGARVIRGPTLKASVGPGEITLEVLGGIDGQLDPRTGRARGAYSSCHVLADHYALESAYAWVIAEVGKYDDEGG